MAGSALVLSACGTSQNQNISNPQQISGCTGKRALLDNSLQTPSGPGRAKNHLYRKEQ